MVQYYFYFFFHLLFVYAVVIVATGSVLGPFDVSRTSREDARFANTTESFMAVYVFVHALGMIAGEGRQIIRLLQARFSKSIVFEVLEDIGFIETEDGAFCACSRRRCCKRCYGNSQNKSETKTAYRTISITTSELCDRIRDRFSFWNQLGEHS